MTEAEMPFTLAALVWRPHLTWVELETATPEQRHALLTTGKAASGSLYSRTLALDPPSLIERAALYDDVMYADGGLTQSERELAALQVSIINGCRYCASVHSRRLATLTKNRPGVQELLDGGPGLTVEPRAGMVARTAEKLTAIPSLFGPADVDELHESGFTDLEIFDLINAAAMFAWANRLMQTLGYSEAAPPVRVGGAA